MYYNEHCISFQLNLARLSSKDYSSRSPIVSKDGQEIAYLQNCLGGSHFKASQLVIFNLETNCERILVDIVKDPKSDSDFPGIFCQRLPLQLFTDKIFLGTCWFDFKVIKQYI